jgi:hypothetical protein
LTFAKEIILKEQLSWHACAPTHPMATSLTSAHQSDSPVRYAFRSAAPISFSKVSL